MIFRTRFSVRGPTVLHRPILPKLCGIISLLVALLAAGRLSAGSTVQTLFSLDSPTTPGRRPYAGVISANAGLLYGTTFQGGSLSGGTVFKVHTDGSGYQALHQFSTNAPEGQSPSGLILASDGVLYGTTAIGGKSKAGTIYKINPDGTGYSVLHDFGVTAGDGQNPQAGLIEGQDGRLYGTTFFGGAGDMGTVFALKKDGTGFVLLNSFTGFNGDGGNPDTMLLQGKEGLLYGTTFFGGTDDQGTVFKLKTDGTGFSVLHSFAKNTADGNNPDAALIQASDGTLLGTTAGGGTAKAGTIYQIKPDGTGYAVVHQFATGAADGQKPLAALLQASNGTIYGTTYLGGSSGTGTLFSLNSDGTGFTVLQSFGGPAATGQNPRGNLALSSNGSLYGATWAGGVQGFGTVFGLPIQTPQAAPQIGNMNVSGGTLHVQISGNSGLTYEVWRSTDLKSWQSIETFVMPSSGTYVHQESPLPGAAAYFRADLKP